MDGDPLTAILVTGPAHGTLSLNAEGAFTYTPAADFNGTDAFTYRANDGALDSNIATVALTITPVNDAPVAVNDAYTTAEDTAPDRGGGPGSWPTTATWTVIPSARSWSPARPTGP